MKSIPQRLKPKKCAQNHERLEGILTVQIDCPLSKNWCAQEHHKEIESVNTNQIKRPIKISDYEDS